MKTLFYFGMLSSVFCAGQEIIGSTCDATRCSDHDVQQRLTTLENRVSQQEIEIQNMKKVEEKLQKDVRDLTNTVNLLIQGGFTPTPGSPITTPVYSTTLAPVIRETPTMDPPTYTIPTKGEMGQEFFLMFPSTYCTYNQLMFSAEQTGWANIRIPFLGISDNITINTGTTYWNITVSVAVTSGTVLENKGLNVYTSVPATLYAMCVEFGVDPYITPIYHKYLLGRDYIVGTYLADKIGIVSISSNTVVNITFQITNNVVYNGVLYRNGDTMTVHMDYLSTFHLSTYSSATGTRIRSNHPVGVIITGMNFGTDISMLRPTADFGKEFISPIFGSNLNTLYLTPVRSNTGVSQFVKGNSYVNSIVNFKYGTSYDDLTYLLSNDSIVVSLTENNLRKAFTIPPVSQYDYNFSCPLPYFNRSYDPAYENNAVILVQSNSVSGIKVNEHIVTNSDVVTSATLNNVTITHIVVNLNTTHHVHVVSQFHKVAAIIYGLSFDFTRFYEYLYQCL